MLKTKEELSPQRMHTNLDYAVEQAASENHRILALNVDAHVENTHIDIADDKQVFISMGQGSRPYQQDRFDAQIVNELAMLIPEEISELLYETAFNFGEKFADVFGHGSTANVVAYVNKTLIIMNLGDTRSVLLGQKALQLSYDHKPSFEPEIKRVQSEGGIISNGKFVKIDQQKQADTGNFYRDIDRRGIAITRTIGNSNYYPGKSHIPSMTVVPIPHTDEEKEILLVIASDGLWDYVSQDDLLKFKNDGLIPQQIADEARKLAYQRSPTDARTGKKVADNCTVLVSQLYENTVYGVWDGHGNSNIIVDDLREEFIKQFRRLAHQYIIDKGQLPPDLPEVEIASTQLLSSQEWDASPNGPNSPEQGIIDNGEDASANASQQQQPPLATANFFKEENELKRSNEATSDRREKRMKVDAEQSDSADDKKQFQGF